MDRRSDRARVPDQDLSCFVGSTFFWLRWFILAALVLLAIAHPLVGYFGLPIWGLVLLFAIYNLLIQMFQGALIGLRAVAWVPLLDLPASSVLYFLSAMPDGPLFVLVLVSVLCAGTCLTLRGSVLYTLASALIVVLLAPVLPFASPDPALVTSVGVNVVVVLLVGVGTAVLMRHVRREHEQARSGWQQAAHLEELERLRTRFFSTITHDLRTPITAIRAAAGMLIPAARQRLGAEELELLESTLRNTKRLGMLIDDLLALNQIEAGVLHIDREPLDLRAVVMQALSTMHPLFQEKDQAIELDLPEPLPCHGDLKYLEHVIVNLMANAHQHTPSGTRIAISGRTSEQEVYVSVCDNGPGIPVEALEAIFRQFHRLSTADGTSGIGLAIARYMVETHDGRIWAESRPGGGAGFHVVLPRTSEGERL